MVSTLQKGSPEAKARMAYLRSLRKKKRGGSLIGTIASGVGKMTLGYWRRWIKELREQKARLKELKEQQKNSGGSKIPNTMRVNYSWLKQQELWRKLKEKQQQQQQNSGGFKINNLPEWLQKGENDDGDGVDHIIDISEGEYIMPKPTIKPWLLHRPIVGKPPMRPGELEKILKKFLSLWKLPTSTL